MLNSLGGIYDKTYVNVIVNAEGMRHYGKIKEDSGPYIY